jgi:heme iron utilization protein
MGFSDVRPAAATKRYFMRHEQEPAMTDQPFSSGELSSILSRHDFAVLATSGERYPYQSLVSIVFTDDRRHLIFPTLRDTQKYANLQKEPNVSLLLDNRLFGEKEEKVVYALTLLGFAREAEGAKYQEYRQQFLVRHPHLAGFLSRPQTALVEVTPEQCVMVEEFQSIRRFAFPVG